MKESYKWLMGLMLIAIPLISLTFFLVVTGMSIKDIPWWVIIGISIYICISLFILWLVLRSTQRIEYNASLQKKRKRLLIFVGVSVIIGAIRLALYRHDNLIFWIQLCVDVLFLFAMFFIIHFSEKKEKKIGKIDNPNS